MLAQLRSTWVREARKGGSRARTSSMHHIGRQILHVSCAAAEFPYSIVIRLVDVQTLGKPKSLIFLESAKTVFTHRVVLL